jgi:hypothetical protein
MALLYDEKTMGVHVAPLDRNRKPERGVSEIGIGVAKVARRNERRGRSVPMILASRGETWSNFNGSGTMRAVFS